MKLWVSELDLKKQRTSLNIEILHKYILKMFTLNILGFCFSVLVSFIWNVIQPTNQMLEWAEEEERDNNQSASSFCVHVTDIPWHYVCTVVCVCVCVLDKVPDWRGRGGHVVITAAVVWCEHQKLRCSFTGVWTGKSRSHSWEQTTHTHIWFCVIWFDLSSFLKTLWVTLWLIRNNTALLSLSLTHTLSHTQKFWRNYQEILFKHVVSGEYQQRAAGSTK